MPPVKYAPVWWARWLGRPFIRASFRVILSILSPIRITGKQNIPKGKPYLVAFNHVSLYEAPLLGSFWPEQLEIMGAVDIWSKPGQNILVLLWGAIPVHREEYDRELFDKVLGALRAGYPVAIAPEGGRSHTPGLRQAKRGIAFLVEKSGVPVIPVGIVGTTDDYWHKASRGRRPGLEMHIGKPVQLPPVEGNGVARHEARQRNADIIMRSIAGLLPENYRGVYTQAPILPDEHAGE